MKDDQERGSGTGVAGGEAQSVTLSMTRPDGVKVTKTLWGDKAYGGLHWRAQGRGPGPGPRWRLEEPRAITDDERVLQAMCLSDLQRVSEKIPT